MGDQAVGVARLGYHPAIVGRVVAGLLEGMRWLRAAGQGPIELDAIGNNELALPLYYDVGFAIKKQGQEFRLDL